MEFGMIKRFINFLLIKLKQYQYRGTHVFGDSYAFLGMIYKNGKNVLMINDKVIIHPVLGHSQAKISYPAKVVGQYEPQYSERYGRFYRWELTVIGIENNKEWKGAWINQYLFDRLEFVEHNYIDLI
jgi:hypothetical protein